MNKIKLINGYELPCICYGTGIINGKMYDENKIKQLLKRDYLISKAILKKDKTYKKNKGVIKCVKQLNNTEFAFFDTSRAYGKAEYMLSQCLSKNNRGGGTSYALKSAIVTSYQEEPPGMS